VASPGERTPDAEARPATSLPMTVYEFLETVHQAYRPRSYLEIGIKTGRSLALSRTKTVAVDPDFAITWEIDCDVQVVKATSDDFFARDDCLERFPDGLVDLAFVDGLHLFEYALRDFMNVERRAAWTSVILIDDVLPRTVARASRDRGMLTAWSGDVYKLTEILAKYRSDLLLLLLDTSPSGLLVVLGADSQNTVLENDYEEVVAEYLHADPQPVPEPLLRCETALDPSSIAHSPVWAELRSARESGLSREVGWDGVRRSVEAAARPAIRREVSPAPPSGEASERKLGVIRRRLPAARRRLRKSAG
jgi:hypothetical protein